MSDTTIPAEVAAHVLWSERQGGHPAGSFTTKLLELWGYADFVNGARLAAAWPEYGAELHLLAQPGGVEQLREIADPTKAARMQDAAATLNKLEAHRG